MSDGHRAILNLNSGVWNRESLASGVEAGLQEGPPGSLLAYSHPTGGSSRVGEEPLKSAPPGFTVVYSGRSGSRNLCPLLAQTTLPHPQVQPEPPLSPKPFTHTQPLCPPLPRGSLGPAVLSVH